jgi:hypothetical protein
MYLAAFVYWVLSLLIVFLLFLLAQRFLFMSFGNEILSRRVVAITAALTFVLYIPALAAWLGIS